MTAPAVMGTSIVIALLSSSIQIRKQDLFLFSICFINQAYFVSHALFRGGKDLPSELRLIVTAVGFCALFANARACGIFGTTNKEKKL